MLRFMDSFDHYATAQLLAKYDAVGGAAGIQTATPRFGAGYLQCTNNNTVASVLRILDAQATWVVGFGFRFSAIPSGAYPIFELRDGATTHITLQINASQMIDVTRAGTVIGTGTIFMSAATWYHVQLKVTISDTGSFSLKIDDVVSVSSGSADTRNAGNASADRFMLRGASGTGAGTIGNLFDDLYVLDGQVGAGSNPNNDFLGDCKIEMRLPNGNGNSSQFVGNDGNSTDNYLLVDEASPNDDTDYVESGTVGNKDTYTYQDLVTATGTVYGVQILPYARKTDAGSRSIVSVARLSGTEVDSSAKALATSYGYFPDVRETKPGGGDWAISDFNSAEFGIKVNA